MKALSLILVLLATSFIFNQQLIAENEIRTVGFQVDELTFESSVVIPPTEKDLPGIFMVPNWLGNTEAAQAKAGRIAEMGFVVYVADVYTAEVRPEGPDEAGEVASALRADRELMRQRLQAAFTHFQSLEESLPVQSGQYGAIGFCFGGGAILELARTGAPLQAFVSFHGDLASPTLESDSKNITGKVLVLHGADDPLVPVEDVLAFASAVREAGVDWQINSYGGAVHSFTDPFADMTGVAEYNEVVAERAFAEMRRLFSEVFPSE
ncbi:MAG: dienelactone hydrolase family protein [Verrucomicrobiales bacterium]